MPFQLFHHPILYSSSFHTPPYTHTITHFNLDCDQRYQHHLLPTSVYQLPCLSMKSMSNFQIKSYQLLSSENYLVPPILQVQFLGRRPITESEMLKNSS